MKTIQTMVCPLPGLDAVEVDYNMMASMDAFDEFVRSNGQKQFDAVVADVRGWPEQFAGGPQGMDAPMAWRLWMAHEGVGAAAQAWVADPN